LGPAPHAGAVRDPTARGRTPRTPTSAAASSWTTPPPGVDFAGALAAGRRARRPLFLQMGAGAALSGMAAATPGGRQARDADPGGRRPRRLRHLPARARRALPPGDGPSSSAGCSTARRCSS
jgi:hypothetical protein